MALPASIVPGTDVAWEESEVPAGATSATIYFRPANGTGGVEVAGVAGAEAWGFALDAVATAGLATGQWLAQGMAVVDGLTVAWLPLSRLEVLPGLLFSGDPAALDLRSATEIELEEVRAAIRAVYKAQEYEIGAGRYMGRRLLRADLAALQRREQALLIRLRAEQGGGRNRRVLIEFAP